MARKAEVRYINSYIAGTAACKPEYRPTQPMKEAKLPKHRRQNKIVIPVDPAATAGICLAVVLLILMIVGAFRLADAQRQVSEMEAYVSRLQVRNEELDETYRAGFDPEEIRQIATAMGMIPMEQAQQIHVAVTVPEPEAEPSVWSAFLTFLTGLFA